MVKIRARFVCQNCGGESPRWQGKCPECDTWNSFVEEQAQPSNTFANTWLSDFSTPGPIPILEIPKTGEERFNSLPELDRVLGGGIVRGSIILLGGSPGVGKSTLLIQVSDAIARDFGPVLYVTGEESTIQTKMRADRIGISDRRLYIVSEIQLERIQKYLEELHPVLAVIDSIQTVYRADIQSAPGSVGQVRECAAALQRISKLHGIATVVIGHVTKDGTLAGPRVLEHIVDAVLYLEGEQHQTHRLLRSFKNRFGSTHEVGLFELISEGMREIRNPSEFFLSSHPATLPGSVVISLLEGTRPLLVELQALTCQTSFGLPRRTVTGVDLNRVAILLAVLEKRLGFPLGGYDVFVNVAGAIQVREPSADLGIAVAVASSFRDQSIAPLTLLAGEVGLTGEIRPIRDAERRMQEAARLGYRMALIPKPNVSRESIEGLQICGVETLAEALALLELEAPSGRYPAQNLRYGKEVRV